MPLQLNMTPRHFNHGNPTPPPTPPLPPGPLTITVGTSPNARTWSLPRPLLERHSAYLAHHIKTSPYQSTLTLPTTCPRAFANFATYMHSSIYALNESVPNFRAIRHHSAAVLLGAQLGSRAYSVAAMRQLYRIFEGLARIAGANSRLSVIRASDVAFVCAWVEDAEHSSLERGNECRWEGAADLGLAIKLREMVVHAIAAHWTRHEIVTIGPHLDSPCDSARWAEVYDEYPEFRAGLHATMGVGDAWRGALLRDVEYYLGFQEKVKEGSEGGYETDSEMSGGVVKRRTRSLKQAKKKVVGMKQRVNSRKLVKKTWS